MRKHIVHHTKRIVHHVRGKPYDVRMQITRFLTVFCCALVVLLWITLLKRQLQVDPTVKKNDQVNKNLFQDQVIRVFSDSKNDTKQNQDNK